MAHLSQDGAPKESTPAPSSPSANRVAHQVRRLSTNVAASATALSPSPSSPSRAQLQRNSSYSSSNGNIPPQSPLHRSPSSMSNEPRSPTPTLLRKASMNSLHGVGGATSSRDRTPSHASPSRRSISGSFTTGSTLVGKAPLSALEDVVEALPRQTAESIARDHFKTELDLHNREDRETADTIVILHDSCYGHRYSRPRTSKASLSTIVERPERIHASILGLSVAYVRLGERHAEGRYPLHPAKDPAEIPFTPFRIQKTTRRLPLSSQAVTNVHGAKWMEELKIMCDNAEQRLAMNGKELTRPDISRSPEQGAPAKLHEGDLYLCSESLNAMEGALGAVCEGVDAVFQGSANGKGPHRTFVAIRPPGHHCSSSYPSGFCWLNNVHVGISHAALTHGLTHAAIIDFDLHHGDGSQAITWEHNRRATTLPKNALPWKKTSIGYFSLHDINSYPCEMGDEEKVKNASLCIENAHGQSIWNTHLQPWKSEIEFWELYENCYSILLEKTRNFLRTQTERLRVLPNGPKPKAAIFLSAGFDASEWESSGMQRHKVNVPTEFYARLTRDVVRVAAEEGTAVDGRIISVLEGGYSDRALCTGVFSHLSGLAGANPAAIKKEQSPNGLGYEISQKIGSFRESEDPKMEPTSPWTQSYDPQWWSLPQLEKLDATVNPVPPSEPKKQRDGPPPTFSSPTQSFIAKVNASPKVQRSMSNSSSNIAVSRKRAPSPPPPEVDWTVSAHELSKLLIPVDRQTLSCKPEDLSAEATRARRDRQSILVPSASVAPLEAGEGSAPRMALRVRKPIKPLIESVEEDDSKKPAAAKAGRRKTVAGAAVLATERATSRSTTPNPALPSYTQPTQQSNRRLSVASIVGSVTSDTPKTRPNGYSKEPSNPPTANPPRPGSSQSIRPDSSMSSRAHSIPPVVVKKTRAPANTRVEPPKPRVRRKSPLNDIGKVVGRSDGTLDPLSKAGRVSLSSKSETPDIDDLTSGIKKININLITKAQKEAKEKAKKSGTNSEASARIAAKVPPKVSKVMPVIDSQGSSMPSDTTTAPTPLTAVGKFAPEIPDSQDLGCGFELSTHDHQNEPPTPQLPPHIPTYTEQASQVPLPASSPIQSTQTPMAAGSTSPSDVFIPYQPEGPTAHMIPPRDAIQWLPPNTSTPSPMKRGDLPVFTAKSAIPFGMNPSITMPTSTARESTDVPALEKLKPFDPAVWDVPETPKK